MSKTSPSNFHHATVTLLRLKALISKSPLVKSTGLSAKVVLENRPLALRS
jgi:hypothetical protein